MWWFANPPRRLEATPAELAAITPAQWRAYLINIFRKEYKPNRPSVAQVKQFHLHIAYEDRPI